MDANVRWIALDKADRMNTAISLPTTSQVERKAALEESADGPVDSIATCVQPAAVS